MLNKVLLIGRIANDVKLYETRSGVPYAKCSIAVDRRSNKKEAQTDFISLVAWRNTATFMNEFVQKGALVSIEGQITTGQYENESGTVIRTTDVVVDNISLLETRSVREQREAQSKTTNSPFKSNSKKNNKTSVNFDFDESELDI